MQQRPFGRTGLSTSILGFGGFHLLEIPFSEADFLLNTYLDAGGNYIETAASYGRGESERKIGRAVSHRRDAFTLVTKTGERDRAGCLDSLTRSLDHLRTDRVDVLLMHGVGTMGELEQILAPGGALEGAEQARREGRVGHIGISMHGQPDVLMAALHSYDFAAVMTTVNYYDRFNFPEIENVLIPRAHRLGAAVILMKPLADGLRGRTAANAFRYAFSRPVSVVVSGINSRAMLAEDLGYAEGYEPLTREQAERLAAEAPELGTHVCRQCGLCMPCPVGIDIPEVFRYEGWYDRQMGNGRVDDTADFALRERLKHWFGNQQLARDRYAAEAVQADRCTHCGLCTPRCPYGSDVEAKLAHADYTLAGRGIY